jgi:hypothetical protein
MPRKFKDTPADPMLPKTPIEIDGKTYFMCFDYRALREAEGAFRAEGHNANLLVSFREFSFDSVSLVFPCAVRRFHPELSWDQAQALVNLGNVFDIGNAIAAAWMAAMPKEKPKEPGDEVPDVLANPTKP